MANLSRLGNAGFALTESLIAMILIVALVIGILFVGYFYFSTIIVSDAGYSSVICLAEGQTKQTCQAKAKKKLFTQLPIGQLKVLRLSKNRRSYLAQIHWQVHPGRIIRYKKRLRYE